MVRTSPEQRRCIAQCYRNCRNKSIVAVVFGVCFDTVKRWTDRANHPGSESFKDKPRNNEPKITVEVEVSIFALRNIFDWGTERIRKGLMCLPDFMREVLGFEIVQGVSLSRSAINNVLKKHGINGYKRKGKSWKFFRAKEQDELWQLDIKGPFTVQGKKYWFLVCIDDYSRYLLLFRQFEHEPRTVEITRSLESLPNKPKNILTDNGAQFKKQWKKWCKGRGIEPLFAHPYYPQDKGKVERTIRNLTEEFIDLLRKFPDWLKGKTEPYTDWFNNKRFHLGIKDFPANLYKVKRFT